MRALSVVEPKVASHTFVQGHACPVILEVDVLVLHCAPQSLDKDVVQCTPLSIHADFHPMLLQSARKAVTGELSPLIRVEDLRLAEFERGIESLQAKSCVKRIGKTPRQHIPAKPIDDRHKEHESAVHWDIRDIRGPHLIGPDNFHIPEQIGIDPVSLYSCARVGTRINGLQTHDSHQPLDALAVDLVALLAEPDGHPTTPVKRGLGVLPVDQVHIHQVLRRLRGRLVVKRRARQADQLALPTHCDTYKLGFNHAALEFN